MSVTYNIRFLEKKDGLKKKNKLSFGVTAAHLVLVQRIEVRILEGQQLVLWCNG